jgi:prephenate dehydratase
MSSTPDSEGATGLDQASGYPRVGYLGPAGTFTEEALLGSALPDSVTPVPLETIYDAVTAVRQESVDWAVAPIENSLDGSVTVTLDLLADERADLKIVAETQLEVRHALIAGEMVELSEIDTVFSHPKVPGQCTHLLRGELAHARILATSSTAEAVRWVVESGQPGAAALGTSLAARLYGGTVVREGVQDRHDNETRFVWLARADRAAIAAPLRESNPESGSKTSLVFWGSGAERPGWLSRCLDELGRRGINLTKIESRPRRDRLGNYMFFADLEGAVADGPVSDAITGMRGVCEEVRVLGSYRRS